MPDVGVLTTYLDEYLTLLQVAAVTGVACVLIISAAGDLFATEPTGTFELGGGAAIQVQKHRGRVADYCRGFIFVVSGLLAMAYTFLLVAIVSSVLAITLISGCDAVYTTKVRAGTLLVPNLTSQTVSEGPNQLHVAQTETATRSEAPNVSIGPNCLVEWITQRLPLSKVHLTFGVFSPGPLRIQFIVAVAFTIMALCWIAFTSTILRWHLMRRPRTGVTQQWLQGSPSGG